MPLVHTHFFFFLYKLLINRGFNFIAIHARHLGFDEESTPQGGHANLFIHDNFFRPLDLHLLVWNELKRSRPFWPMRDLGVKWVTCLQGHFTHETESLWLLHFKHSHSWKRQSRFKFASHCTWGTNGLCECMMDVKSTCMESYMASNGSYCMVTWTIFKTHLLEVCLTQNRETMALRTLKTVDLFYLTMCENPHK